MKKLKIIILVTGVLVAWIASSASAQKRPERTSSARAAYGVQPERPKHKLGKKQKVRKQSQVKPAKGTRAGVKTARYRKENSL